MLRVGLRQLPTGHETRPSRMRRILARSRLTRRSEGRRVSSCHRCVFTWARASGRFGVCHDSRGRSPADAHGDRITRHRSRAGARPSRGTDAACGRPSVSHATGVSVRARATTQHVGGRVASVGVGRVSARPSQAVRGCAWTAQTEITQSSSERVRLCGTHYRSGSKCIKQAARAFWSTPGMPARRRRRYGPCARASG